MKLCANCAHHLRAPFQQGGRAGMISVCTNTDYRNPVDGSPIPALAARQERDLCGYPGRGFIQIPTVAVEDAQIIEERVVNPSPIIIW